MTIRSPLITPAARRKTPQQPQVLANLLQTTLAPVGAVQRPFNRTEWPNPVRAPLTMSRHFLVTTSFFDSAVPDIKFDFQNPVRKRKVQQPDIFPNRVLGFPFPPQRQRSEFQNPLPARRVQQPVVLPNLVLNTLFVTPPVPKILSEFQNPVIARRVRQPDVFQRLPDYLALVGSDTTPDQFSFTDQSGVALSATITSAAVTITGIDAAAAITVSGGTYDIDGSGTFTADPGTVTVGQTVRARHTSSASYSTATNTVVTIGGVGDTFTSTTLADPAALNWYVGGTAVNAAGIMGTSFLDDVTPVPSTKIMLGGIAHSPEGLRYVALWPASDVAFYNGGRAIRSDGAMIIATSGTAAGYYGGIAMTFRGETIVSTSQPEVVHNGFGLRETGALCVSDAS
jgi:hypothetical protein